MKKNISILGSTGSIGRQALQVIDAFPEKFKIIALAAGENVNLFAEQIDKYKPQYAAIANSNAEINLKNMIQSKDTIIMSGESALLYIADLQETDLILISLSGITGLKPTIRALQNNITVALANKETLVTAGDLVMQLTQKTGTKIIPVDSEHSAIFQCLDLNNTKAINRLILTASGGPFLSMNKESIALVSSEDALNHPKWKMGNKITIDSAGMINKGLEVIEAHWLFNMPYEKINVLIHPQSIVHSMVEYQDGSVLAQCGLPDMRIPIQYALTYPQRFSNPFPKIDFTKIEPLIFAEPDNNKFPGLALAYEAGKAGGTAPTVYNAANEIAVQLFLEKRIKFYDIPMLIESALKKHHPFSEYSLEDVLFVDEWARRITLEKFSAMCK